MYNFDEYGVRNDYYVSEESLIYDEKDFDSEYYDSDDDIFRKIEKDGFIKGMFV